MSRIMLAFVVASAVVTGFWYFSCRSGTDMVRCDLGTEVVEAEDWDDCSSTRLQRLRIQGTFYVQLDQRLHDCERDLRNAQDDLQFEQGLKKPVPADVPMIRTVCGYVKNQPDQRFCQVIVNSSFFDYGTGWSCEWHQDVCVRGYLDLLDKKTEACGGYITCQREPSEITPPPGPSAPQVPLIWRGGEDAFLQVPGYSPRDSWM